MPAKRTTSGFSKVLGTTQIGIATGNKKLLKALYEAFYRDSKDTRSRYSIKLEEDELIMYVEGLDIGDLRAFTNSNLRLLKVILEGLKVVR